jgi:urease accessory protein UreH/urease accessory protein UreF
MVSVQRTLLVRQWCVRQQQGRRNASFSPADVAIHRANTMNMKMIKNKDELDTIITTPQEDPLTNHTAYHRNSTPPFAWMKHGIGRLTATVDHDHPKQPTTKLTQVSHKAPMRWLPLRSSRVQQAGAAVAAMGTYGGGLLPGDVNKVQIQVQRKARLGILTQGSNRIYKQKQRKSQQQQQQQQEPCQLLIPAKTTLQAQVEQEGFLVLAPDPTVPFADSVFHQQQEFILHSSSSLVAIDWFSSGRFANGERWQATRISSETKLTLAFKDNHHQDHHDQHHQETIVWDATTLDQTQFTHNNNNNNNNRFGFDLGQNSFNAYASMLLYGKESLPVVEQLQALQYHLAIPFTRLRMPESIKNTTTNNNNTTSPLEDDNHPLNGTTGRILLGISELQVTHNYSDGVVDVGPVYMARWAASSNEDLYRMFHHALKPLAPRFGMEFYQDRIRAKSSGPVADHRQHWRDKEKERDIESTKIFPSVERSARPQSKEAAATDTTLGQSSKNNDAAASWNAYMLADSALPTGSFAHSAGLEVASQLGLLVSKNKESTNDQDVGDAPDDNHNVQAFIQASARSTLQQATPWIRAGHTIGSLCSKSEASGDIMTVSELLKQWRQLDRHVHSLLVCQAPACRASLDQGRNLLRVAVSWLQANSNSKQPKRVLELLQSIQAHIVEANSTTSGHVAPLFGILGNALGLTDEQACHLMGFCAARDIVSAALRLNLIGPLESVAVLSRAQAAAQEGIQIHSGESHSQLHADLLWTDPVHGGCAPILDAIHPCHDMLSVRLFRT